MYLIHFFGLYPLFSYILKYRTLRPLPVNMGTWNSMVMGGFYHAFSLLVWVRLATAVRIYS